jgi:RimJ/RimL family protein N-acetyltransferase
MIPMLESERLLLRAHRIADFEACLDLWTDPEVTRYVGGRPFSGEEVWARLLRYIGHWSLLGFGYWLVADKASGIFVGEVGFADFKRQIAPSFEGIPEIGWALMPWAQGRGLATEAVQRVVAWGDQHFGPGATTGCLINPDNHASFRVAGKAGYSEYCRTFYKEHPAVILRR